MKYITYVGSYTSNEHPEGIHVLESDAETGAFRVVNVIDTVPQPIYMALNRDGTMLYSVTGRSAFGPNGRNGGLAAFRLNAKGADRFEIFGHLLAEVFNPGDYYDSSRPSYFIRWEFTVKF